MDIATLAAESKEQIVKIRAEREQMKSRPCGNIEDYEKLERIEEGTFGVVFKARDKQTGEVVAVKKFKEDPEGSHEGFPLSALRELKTLMKAVHMNVIHVKAVVTDREKSTFYVVMEFMSWDLRKLVKQGQVFSMVELRSLLFQLLSAVEHLHINSIFHRDIKTANLLLNEQGVLKLCDMGLAKEYTGKKQYTPKVVTLRYRAPELLLKMTYGKPVDLWSVGCVFAEVALGEPLMSGYNEGDQLKSMFEVLGTPTEEIWPGFSRIPLINRMPNLTKRIIENNVRARFKKRSRTLTALGFDLLERLLTYDPNQRITASEALKHGFFTE